MSPRIGPRPPDRHYHVVITEVSEEGSAVAFEHHGQGYVVAVGNMASTRIIADVDHDGHQFLKERLVAYITQSVIGP